MFLIASPCQSHTFTDVTGSEEEVVHVGGGGELPEDPG